MLGVLACPNLPFTSIANLDGHSSENQIGCLFSAQTGCGAYMQLLHEPSAAKVVFSLMFYFIEVYFRPDVFPTPFRYLSALPKILLMHHSSSRMKQLIPCMICRVQ